MQRIVPRLTEADSEVAALKTRTLGVAKCLSSAGAGVLDAQQVQHLGQLALQLLSNSLERRKIKEHEQQLNAKKADAQDLDETRDEEDDDEEDLLRTYSMVMAAALMEHHPDFFMTHCFAAYLPVAQQLLQPSASDSDRQLAAQLGANICEHLGERAVSQWPSFVPQLLENMHAQNSDVRGTACFAISMAARSPAFAAQAGVAAQRATQVVLEARSRANKKSDKEAQCAADNAVSVLLEILEHHPSAAQGDLWGAWLAGLPCQEDTEEGTRNNKALLRLTKSHGTTYRDWSGRGAAMSHAWWSSS